LPARPHSSTRSWIGSRSSSYFKARAISTNPGSRSRAADRSAG
jgi:hypothetical protein